MIYLSLFSGIEAASVAWRPLGWTPAAFAEIEPFPCAVLAQRFPGVPNLGDVSKITDEQIAALGHIDIVVGGSPCQDLSVCGQRAGLAGKRSGLFHELVRIFHAARTFCGARFLLWENVPGIFSSNKGRDFARVVMQMAGCYCTVPLFGWRPEGVALGEHGLLEWAVLDAQWFGVAQRRARCFALLDAGDWAHRPPILLECDRLRGYSPPRREAREDTAAALAVRASREGGVQSEYDGGLIAAPLQTTCGDYSRSDNFNAVFCSAEGADGIILTASNLSKGINNQTPIIAFQCKGGAIGEMGALRGGNGNATGGVPFITAFHGSQDPSVSGDVTHPVGRNQGQETCIVEEPYTLAIRGRGESHDLEYRQDGTANALITPNGGRGGIGVGAIARGSSIRRLTPRECERLQGFPDDHTLVMYRGKPAADSPRYRAIGNSMAVPCMAWIGRQIQAAAGVEA
jgi:DNA (cytosine-5)-methyltransferase 1